MRALLAIPLVLVTQAVANEHRFVSPNGEFEAYTTAANQEGTGTKLFLRRATSRDTGVLLKQNNRWIDAKWSPDSKFVAVVDHLDGHISDVYVFGVAGADAAPILLYHPPNLRQYDVRWEVIGWNLARREIILEKAVKHEGPGRITREKVKARIGTEPLKLAPTD